MKKISLLLFAPFALFILSACSPISSPQKTVSSFEECVAAGNPVMESYPRQCRHEGQVFVEKVSPPSTPVEETPATNDETASRESSCTSNNGTWLSSSQECEGISKEVCEQLGGTFNECASACRNNPEAVVCTMQCVIVCQFAK